MKQMIQINDTTWINKGFILEVNKMAGEEKRETILELNKESLWINLKLAIESQKRSEENRDVIKDQIKNLKGKDDKEEYDKLTKELKDIQKKITDVLKTVYSLESIQDLFEDLPFDFSKEPIESYIKKLEKADPEQKYYSVKTETIPGESYYEIIFINGVKKEIKHPEEMQVVTDNILKAEA